MNTTSRSAEDIAQMRTACRLASEVLDYVTPFVKPGVTTGELDQLCLHYMRDVQGTRSATLGYAPPGYPAFPGAICTSVNDVVCHGIPGARLLKSGDIVNLDVAIVTPSGYYGDTSRMFLVGDVSILAKRLARVTFECMWKGIEQVRPGARTGDIGHAIQTHAELAGFGVVREYCGHGIGKQFHEEPQILHYGRPGTGVELRTGMIFTIEPMLNGGRRDIRTMPDCWTVKTRDRSLSAQWEHAVLVTDHGHEVLTVSAGTQAPPSFE